MRRQRGVRWPVYGGVVIALVATMVLSPFLTTALARFELEWPLLSNVGESYGAVATVLSGAALIGVVAAAILQARQTRISAEQAVRQMHLEIQREAWKDPNLLRATELVPLGREELARRFAFLNIYFMYLRMGYLSGHISIDEIEDLAAHSFSTSAGNYYWRRVSSHLHRHFERNFVQALERGFERSQEQLEGFFLDDEDVAAGPKPSNSERARIRRTALMTSAAVAGALASEGARRLLSRSR